MRYFLLLIMSLFLSVQASANSIQLYTNQGYPYSNLINHTDQVKIFFTEKQSKTICRVEISKGDKHWNSSRVQVETKHFQQAPLASCLQRSMAKSILKQSRLL